MAQRVFPAKFLVAFSYASEQRTLVEAIAEAVETQVGDGMVFYDQWFQSDIPGPDADKRLKEIYATRSELVVVCVSEEYGKKAWPLAEDEAIRGRIIESRASSDPRDVQRIYPLRLGPGAVDWLPITTATLDVVDREPGETANLIVNRLKRVWTAGHSASVLEPSRRYVYLAECPGDLDDPDKVVNRSAVKDFVERLGWTVLPEGEYPDEEYPLRVEEDLKRSLAFIQLRGAYPWKPGRRDRLQNDLAIRLKVERFLYRSSDINLEKVDKGHVEFLTEAGVIADSFDDFKQHLKKQLTVLATKAERARKRSGDGEGLRPLVRVVTRSGNPEAHWDQVYQWIYDEGDILSDLLGSGESFESAHDADPCHGFLVVCDSAALEGRLSPQEHMRQCRRIQFREKLAEKRPPVAVVYWLPPEPTWSKLLRAQPDKLYRASANCLPLDEVPAELDQFFDEVRKVAR